MRHIIIMPEDCYKADSGRLKDCIVRRSSMGVEMQTGFNEVRYLFDLSPEAIEQAWRLHTCDVVVTPCDGDNFPCQFTYVPKDQKSKMVAYA